MISTLPLTSGLANLATVPATFVSSLLGISPSAITPAMEEEIKRQILSDARRTGKYSGGIQYEDLGFDSVWDDEGEHPTSHYSKAGLFSPQTALGLTAGKLDWAVDPATGEISFPGGTEYNFPDSFGKGLSDFINKQNTKYDPSNSLFNLGQPLKIDPATFKGEINLFNPAERNYQRTQQIMNPMEVYPYTSDYYKAKFQDIPHIDMSKPTVQPTAEPTTPVQPPVQPITPAYQPPVQPRVNNVSPGGGNSRRGPSYAQQAAAVNRKSASMGAKSPIRRSGNKYGFGL
jgi:hypothetical protein